MKICLSIALVFLSVVAAAQTQPKSFIKFKNQVYLERFLANHPNTKRVHKNLLWVEGTTSELQRANEQFSDAGVIGFEPNRTYRIPPTQTSIALNENITPELWGITNINADKAWSQSTGENVLVAIIDSGINYNHASLVSQINTNTAELHGQPGVDDDNNGYIDDVYGYDFINNDSDPIDDNGHGSHVAGTVAGNHAKNNFWGVAPKAKLLAVKTHNQSGSGSEESVVKGILYAADRGAKVLNSSWAGAPEAAEYSQLLFDAIQYASQKGAIFIASSGNEGSNIDDKPNYPASYEVANLVSVGSSTRNNKLSYFSNYGRHSVDLVAPGSRIFSVNYKGGYSYKDGTSMSSPHVSGAAALIYSRFPGATAEFVKAALMEYVRAESTLTNITLTGGILDVKFLSK